MSRGGYGRDRPALSGEGGANSASNIVNTAAASAAGFDKGKPRRTFTVILASNRTNMRAYAAAVALLAGGCFFGYRDGGAPNAPRAHRGTFVRDMVLTGELNAADGSTI